MPEVADIIAEAGVNPTLQHLATSNKTAFFRVEIENLFQQFGSAVPGDAVDRCLTVNLLSQIGPRLSVSAFGRRSVILFEALNGGDIEAAFHRLRRLGGVRAMYELVRQGMTRTFFKSISSDPNFGRIYICSPWINPSKAEAGHLTYAMLQSDRRGNKPEVLVITRPPQDTPPETHNGLDVFRRVGAKIFFIPRVHSKLYIREPGANGGISLAIVGSQNLTRSNNFELGIRINNDSLLANDLIRYFYELMSISEEER